MQDQFTEVTSKGWLERLGESIKGVVFGLLLFVVAFPVLFWGEGRAVKRARTLESGAKQVITVKADAVDPSNNNKLVHLNGEAKTEETLSDPDFGVSANAIKLDRVVQMYQWKEHKESKTRKKLGGGQETVTEYSYEKAWAPTLIKSGDFKKPEGHDNPGAMRYEGKTLVAQNVTLGAFTLSPEFVKMINQTEALPVTEETLEQLQGDLRKESSISAGGFYIGKDSAAPAIGDLKISFKIVKQPIAISLVAGQVSNTFEPFKMKDGDIQLLQVGTLSADAMFKQAEEENQMLTWILRLVGFLMMMFGITMIFRPLTVTADVLPFLGDLLGMGIGLFAGVIAFALSLFTISIAWVFYRPLIGIPLLIVSVGAIVAFKFISKKKAA